MSVSAAMTTNQQMDQRHCAPSFLAAAGDGLKKIVFNRMRRGVSPFSSHWGTCRGMAVPSKQLALVEATSSNNFSPVMTSRSKKPNLQAAEAVGPPCVGSSGDGCR